ncbi:MAG: hypothetical protein IKP00_11045 [Victivallales bacterium]|nr:hypothetical protein [Victivallales bacterium]
MRTFLLKGKSFWLVLGLLFLLPSFAVIAQEADDDDEDDEEQTAQADPDAWKAARDEIAKTIKIEIDKRVKQKVKHENIVRDLNLGTKLYEDAMRKNYEAQIASFVALEKRKWERNMIAAPYPNVMARKEFQLFSPPVWKYPVDKPKAPMEMIKSEMEKNLDKLFVSTYPLKAMEELEKEGRKKYPLIELTEDNPRPHVKFTLREGFGTNANVEGRLQKINSERLQVQTSHGTRMLTRKDLSEETQALFYKDVNAKYVKDYVDDEIRKYNALREGFVADWTQYILPNALIVFGYVPNVYLTPDPKTKKPETVIRQSTNLKKWVTRIEYEAKIYKTQYEAEKKRITPSVEKEFYEHAAEKELYSENFVYRKEEKEWVPESVAAEREAAARAAEANPNGGGPDDMEPGPPPM